MPATETTELVLPTVELPRGVDVKGSVVNERGEPVAGVQVESRWERRRSRSSPPHCAAPIRMAASRYAASIRIAELKLTAWDGYASTDGAMTDPGRDGADQADRPDNRAPEYRAPGRPSHRSGGQSRSWCVDPTVAQRACQGRTRDGHQPILFGDPFRSIRTDSQGRYRSPRRLPLGGEYYARPLPREGSQPFQSRLRLAEESSELPAVVLRRVRTIAGQMVDGQESPSPARVVRQAGNGPMPTRAITAQDGHFQLAGVREGPAVLIAEKDGFRFHLQPIDDEVETIKISAYENRRKHLRIDTKPSPRPGRSRKSEQCPED